MQRRISTMSLTLLLLFLTAAPAAADPPAPTNYRSTIEAIQPENADIDIDVLGGDAFLVLSARPGTTVTVEGYDGEPYLRFLPDGTVARNAASPARWLNDARYGALDVTVPAEANAEAPPRWEQVAGDGTYAWHDHRIHWMSPVLPRQIDATASSPQPVQEWRLDLAVDDQPVTVSGQLVWVPSTTPLGAFLAFAAVAAAGLWVVLRRSEAATMVAALAAVAATVVGASTTVGLPSGAQADPTSVLLPVGALLLAAVAVAIRRRPGVGPRVLGGMAGLPVVVWCVLRAGALTAPILPTPLPPAIARSLIAMALAAALVAVIGGVRSALSTSSSDPDAGGVRRPRNRSSSAPPGRPVRGQGRHPSVVLAVSAAQPLLLAHAGEGASWQALLVVLSLGLAVVFGLVVAGRVSMSEPDDLVLPLASVAVISSLAPIGATLLSDWVGWAFPIGVVALVALLATAFSPLEYTLRAPVTYGAVALAVVGAIGLQAPITRAWHPPLDYLPLADDAQVEILEPMDGVELDAGTVEVRVTITGGTLGPGDLTLAQLPTDPTEAGDLTVTLDDATVEFALTEPCSVELPCRVATFPLDVDSGTHELRVEFVRGDGMPLAPMVTDRITFSAR